MTLTMYDSVDISQIPPNAQAVAGYTSGRWVTYPHLVAAFPHAHVLSIAVNAAHDADCLDVETGDATPAQGAAWYQRQKTRGVTRPCLYASVSVMQADILPALSKAGISRAAVRLWSAHYTGSAHICGPSTCRQLGIAADGTQWTDRALGRNLDESLLADSFFGGTSDWTETLVNSLPTLKQGDADKPGGIAFVGRAQALAKFIGDRNKLPAASAVTASGKFDQATWTGVLAIQKFFGLTQDGIVGPATWGALVAAQRG